MALTATEQIEVQNMCKIYSTIRARNGAANIHTGDVLKIARANGAYRMLEQFNDTTAARKLAKRLKAWNGRELDGLRLVIITVQGRTCYNIEEVIAEKVGEHV